MGNEDNVIIVHAESQGSNVFRYFTSFLKKFITVSSIYLFGYYDWSIGWLVAPVILSILRQEWNRRKELKRDAVRMLMKDEKKVIMSVLGKDLPSWVFFPDVDRAEWLNKILHQLWPNVTTYAHDLIKTTVQSKIQETLEVYGVKGFEFVKMRLGTMPPRIGGIKVYERHHSRTEIMMDIDLIYSGDCDISFTVKGLSGGIKDFQIHGNMRVILKPLIPVIPFVGGVQIFFLNKPDIDFNLVGVADVLDIPGISDVLRKVIVEQISSMMVLPNKLPIVLSETVPAQEIKTPEPAGIVRVHVVKGIQLMKKDVGVLGKGKSDPYIIVTMGAQEFRSKTIDNTVEPKWDFWCEFPIEKSSLEHQSDTGPKIILNVFDQDDSSTKDDFLGWAILKLDEIFTKGSVDKWLTLEGVKHGMVYLRLTYYALSSNVMDLGPTLEEFNIIQQTGISSSILIFYLDSIQNLPDAKPNKRPDPVVSLTAGRSTKSTGVLFRTNSPVYEQGFMFMIHNPKNESLTLKVTDQKSGIDLGYFYYPLSSLLDADDLTRDLEPSPMIKSGSNCKLVFSAQLKILKKVVGKESDSTNVAVPTVTPPSTPSITSAASADIILSNGTAESSTPKSNDETFNNILPKTNEDNLDTSVQSIESLGIVGSDADGERQKKENVKDTFSSPESLANVSTGSISKHKSFSGSIKGSLRKRQTSQASIRSCGSIELTLDYAKERQKLLVCVHRAIDLYVKDPTDLPDPYVKVYLLPKSEDHKRKTKVVKDSANPVYEEYFEYVLSDDEVKDKKINISVLSHKTAFYGTNSVLGQVTLTLSELNLNNYRASYLLEPNVD